MSDENFQKLLTMVSDASRIVIIQADNPDGDSVASSLALEHILGDLGKNIVLYCGIDVPKYLQYLPGWDRIQREVPSQFDLSIIVDTSSKSLLEQLDKSGQLAWVAAKPCVILDHHSAESTIDFAEVSIITKAVATGELIYDIATKADWAVNQEAAELLAVSIMSDSLGLTTDKTTSHSIRVVADLVDLGVSLTKLEDARRLTLRKSPELVHYKGALLQRVEYFLDDQLAMITIPWEEIEKYSPIYNPSILALDDMRLTERTRIALAFKLYPTGRITAKIRANMNGAVANKLAEHFGGGGHPASSGFKVEDGRSYETIKQQVIEKARELLEAS